MFLLHLERTLLNPLALHIVFGLLYSLIDFLYQIKDQIIF